MEIDQEKYTCVEKCLNAVRLNILAVELLVVMYFGVKALYGLLYGAEMPRFIPLSVLGWLVFATVLHELIHGIMAAAYAENGWRSLKFGVLWKYGVVYCHCKELLTPTQFRLVAIMPSVAAFVTLVIGFGTNCVTLIVVSALMLVGGIGDYMMFWGLRKVGRESLVYDMPDKLGYRILTPKEDL